MAKNPEKETEKKGTKILHVSDTHIGYRQYRSQERKEDFLSAFEKSIQKAIEKNVDCVIHTGDLFDSRDPSLNDVIDCTEVLSKLKKYDIPFYGIVGNHESKRDRQWLDLLNQSDVAKRLSKEPTIINDEVILYGIDSISQPLWDSYNFKLEPPEKENNYYKILCMHQLLHPPLKEIEARHETQEVLDRLNIEIDALALGDYHDPIDATVDDVEVWYPGSTERCAADETPGYVSILKIDENGLRRKNERIEGREFIEIEIDFGKGDSHDLVRKRLEEEKIQGSVIIVTLKGEKNSVTASDVKKIANEKNTTVCKVREEREKIETQNIENKGEIENIDSMIEKEIREKDINDSIIELEEIARKSKTPKSSLRDDAKEKIKRQQEKAFTEVEKDVKRKDQKTKEKEKDSDVKSADKGTDKNKNIGKNAESKKGKQKESANIEEIKKGEKTHFRGTQDKTENTNRTKTEKKGENKKDNDIKEKRKEINEKKESQGTEFTKSTEEKNSNMENSEEDQSGQATIDNF